MIILSLDLEMALIAVDIDCRTTLWILNFSISFFFPKENEQCVTDFDKLDFKNLTKIDKFTLTAEIGNCIEDPEKKLKMLRKID